MGTPEDVAAEKYFTPPEMTKQEHILPEELPKTYFGFLEGKWQWEEDNIFYQAALDKIKELEAILKRDYISKKSIRDKREEVAGVIENGVSEGGWMDKDKMTDQIIKILIGDVLKQKYLKEK